MFSCCRVDDADVGEVMGEEIAPRGDPDVTYRAPFVEALHKEYVLGVNGSVGNFFDGGVPNDVANMFEPLENQVRDSQNPATKIASIAKSWGLRPPGGASKGKGKGEASASADSKSQIQGAFLTALYNEFVLAQQNSVGTFLDSGIPPDAIPTFEGIEEQIRIAPNPAEAITQQARKWGLPPPGGAGPPNVGAGHLMSGTGMGGPKGGGKGQLSGGWSEPFPTTWFLTESDSRCDFFEIVNQEGLLVLQTNYRRDAGWFNTDRALVDVRTGQEIIHIVRKSFKMTTTFHLKKDGLVIATLRKTIFGDSEASVCLYEGEEDFTMSNRAKSGKPPMFTFRSFYTSWSGKKAYFCCLGESDQEIARTIEMDQGWFDFFADMLFDMSDKYCVEIAPNTDFLLILTCFTVMHDIFEQLEEDREG